MKPLIILSFLFFISVSGNAQAVEDTIHWSASRLLTYADFKCPPDLNSTFAAETSAGISYSYSYSSDKGMMYSMTCYFSKTKSWMKKEFMNPYILKHEQGHFDIAEIFARKLDNALKNYKVDFNTVKSDLRSIYTKVIDEKDALNEQYDNETQHSVDTAKQREWNQKIEMMISEGNNAGR